MPVSTKIRKRSHRVRRSGEGTTVEEIELRANEIYLKRGDADGVALEDWLAAEKELSATTQKDASGPLVKPRGRILMLGDFR